MRTLLAMAFAATLLVAAGCSCNTCEPVNPCDPCGAPAPAPVAVAAPCNPCGAPAPAPVAVAAPCNPCAGL